MQKDVFENEQVAAVEKKSTSDPFEVNLADISIAEALQSKYTSPALRICGWIFLVFPCVVIAFIGTFMIWRPLPSNWIDASPEIAKFEDFIFNIFLSIVLWSFPIFWIVVLRSRSKGEPGVRFT
jgi:hypothetical protein